MRKRLLIPGNVQGIIKYIQNGLHQSANGWIFRPKIEKDLDQLDQTLLFSPLCKTVWKIYNCGVEQNCHTPLCTGTPPAPRAFKIKDPQVQTWPTDSDHFGQGKGNFIVKKKIFQVMMQHLMPASVNYCLAQGIRFMKKCSWKRNHFRRHSF